MNTNFLEESRNITYELMEFKFSIILKKDEFDTFISKIGFNILTDPDTCLALGLYGTEINIEAEIIDSENIELTFWADENFNVEVSDKEELTFCLADLSNLLQMDNHRGYYLSYTKSLMYIKGIDEDYMTLLNNKVTKYYSKHIDNNVSVEYSDNNEIVSITVKSEHASLEILPGESRMILYLECYSHKIQTFIQENSLISSSVKEHLLRFYDAMPLFFQEFLEPIGLNKYIFG